DQSLLDLATAYSAAGEFSQIQSNMGNLYSEFLGHKRTEVLPGTIVSGDTFYAIIDPTSEFATLRGKLNSGNLTVYLQPNKYYIVELFNPNSNSYGFSTLQTGASGSGQFSLNGSDGSFHLFAPISALPNVSQDGLSDEADFILGLDTSRPDGIVPGI